MGMIQDRGRLIEKPFFAILLLAILLLVSTLIPRMMNPYMYKGLRIEYARPTIKYKWVNNTCLLINISINRGVYLERIVIYRYNYTVNEYIGNIYTRVICLDQGLNKTVYGRVYYRVGGTSRYRLFTVNPPR